MAKNDNVFGFDQLTKSFEKMQKKYPNDADAMLMAQGRAVTNKTKSLSPVGKTKKLKGSWRLKKVKTYKGGKVRVVRIQSEAPHAHLIEHGHEIVPRTVPKQLRRSIVKSRMVGIKAGKRVEGKKMLEKSIKEAESRFLKDAEKMLDVLTKEVEM